MASEILVSPEITEYEFILLSLFSIPRPVLALPWGSKSISNIFKPTAAKPVAKLIAVVVLPTPPF